MLEVPKDGEWIICGDSGEDSKWYTHESGKWMYNSEEHVYFHIESQKIVPDLAYFEAKNEENHPDDYQDGVDLQYQDELGDPNQSEIDLENESEEEISMDFNKDLIAGTESRMVGYKFSLFPRLIKFFREILILRLRTKIGS